MDSMEFTYKRLQYAAPSPVFPFRALNSDSYRG